MHAHVIMLSAGINININIIITFPSQMKLDKGNEDPNDCECVNCRLARIEKMPSTMEESIDKMIEECEKASKD